VRRDFGDQPFKWSDNQIDEPFELFDKQIHGLNSLSINTAEEGEEGASEASDEAIVEGGPSEQEVSGTEIEE
jgi:hypothetical protein